jgi:YD repeat-containing protein
MTDREKVKLRGPVRNCVYESTMPDGKKFLTTMEYTLDGKLLTTRSVQSEGSEWVTSQTYDAEGRLIKTVSGNLGEPSTESVCAYDGAGRLQSITNSTEKRNRTDFRYDEHGRKTTIQTFDPKTLQSIQNSAFCGSPWDAAQAGSGVPAGGNVTTIYGEDDQPTEAQVRDAEARTVSRLVRTYDTNGRITEENQIQENPALLMVDKFSAEQRVELDDKQLDAMNQAMKSMLSGRSGTGKTYTYDPQGRVQEVRDRNFALDTVTTTSYNEHGDKSEERMTRTENTAFPVGVVHSMDENGTLIPKAGSNTPSVPRLPKLEIIECRYEYDQYGNWTEQTVVRRSESNEYSTVRHRKLTYY